MPSSICCAISDNPLAIAIHADIHLISLSLPLSLTLHTAKPKTLEKHIIAHLIILFASATGYDMERTNDADDRAAYRIERVHPFVIFVLLKLFD